MATRKVIELLILSNRKVGFVSALRVTVDTFKTSEETQTNAHCDPTASTCQEVGDLFLYKDYICFLLLADAVLTDVEQTTNIRTTSANVC